MLIVTAFPLDPTRSLALLIHSGSLALTVTRTRAGARHAGGTHGLSPGSSLSQGRAFRVTVTLSPTKEEVPLGYSGAGPGGRHARAPACHARSYGPRRSRAGYPPLSHWPGGGAK